MLVNQSVTHDTELYPSANLCAFATLCLKMPRNLIVDAYLSTVDQTTNTIFYMALTKINQQS